jgi:hypothetical protein
VAAWSLHPENDALRLELVEPPAGRTLADLVDPFVTLGRGTFSRTLLGALAGPRGDVVREVALTLQSDEYPLLPDEVGTTCADVDRGWVWKIGLLERTDRGARAAALVEVLAREPGEPALLPPTLFCKERRAFFASVCPTCGGRLRDVRDDVLLERVQLPRRDRALVRFVACRECLAAGRRQFWTLVREAGTPSTVGDQLDLLRAYASLARQPGSVLPCQGCERVPTCYPDDATRPPDVVRMLVPVTFFEARAIATEPLVLRWDECMALVGGAPWADIVARIDDPGRAAFLRRVAARVGGEPTHLFAHDATGRWPLEVLRLKVGLFAALCRAVAELHRHARTPHLAITPARVMARLGGDVGGLPSAWRLSPRLLGLGHPRPPGAGDDPAVAVRRPRTADPVFAAPVLRERLLADLPVAVTLRRVQASGAGVVLEADLEVDRIDAADVGEKDVLEVAITQGRPPLALVALGTADAGEGRRLRFRSAPVTVDPATRATLEQLVGQTLSRARLAIHPCVHVPVDVYALGMMLFTGLLANEVQPTADVARAVEDAASRLALAARGATDARVLEEQAVRYLAGEPFAARQVFANPVAHEAGAAAIPDELWKGVLLVGLRAVTGLRGFSVCRGLGDFDPAHPEVKAEYLAQLADGMVRRIDAALFGLPGRVREVRAAIARVAHDLKVD